MKKSKFSESQIVAILKEGEAGVAVEQILRKHGISRATYYGWKSKYGGATIAGEAYAASSAAPRGLEILAIIGSR